MHGQDGSLTSNHRFRNGRLVEDKAVRSFHDDAARLSSFQINPHRPRVGEVLTDSYKQGRHDIHSSFRSCFHRRKAGGKTHRLFGDQMIPSLLAGTFAEYPDCCLKSSSVRSLHIPTLSVLLCDSVSPRTPLGDPSPR
jgi:hypothetical protein